MSATPSRVLEQAGHVRHNCLFFQDSGEPIRFLNYPRHSVTTMLRVYAAWADGAIEADIAAIQRAMERRPTPLTRIATEESERSRHALH